MKSTKKLARISRNHTPVLVQQYGHAYAALKVYMDGSYVPEAPAVICR